MAKEKTTNTIFKFHWNILTGFNITKNGVIIANIRKEKFAILITNLLNQNENANNKSL